MVSSRMKYTIALLFALCLSAQGQAVRNNNGLATNLTFYGNNNRFEGDLFTEAGFQVNNGIEIAGSHAFTTGAGLFAGNGGGLTNLVGATNFTSTVTYNFNGKTTFNSVSYNTNAWAGPTNTLVLTTNYQDFVASTDCNITAVGGQLAGQNTWSTLTVSNSTAGNIIVRVTASGLRAQGGSTTNALTIGAGKEGVLSFLSRDFKSTNYVTTAQSN